MDYKKIETILEGAIENTSGSSEKISDKVQAASTIFTSKNLNDLSYKIDNLNHLLENQVESLSREIKNLNNSLEVQVNKIIESNKILSKSSDRHSSAMVLLTIFLTAVAFMQSSVLFLEYKRDQKIVFEKKNCYQAVLQTNNIEQNYKNCLMSKGLLE